MVFESVFYKGISKINLLFEIFLRLYQVHMRGELILNGVHISGTRIIKAIIYGLLKVNNLGGMTRGINPSQSVPLDKGAVPYFLNNAVGMVAAFVILRLSLSKGKCVVHIQWDSIRKAQME